MTVLVSVVRQIISDHGNIRAVACASTGDTSANATWTLLHGPCLSIPAGTGSTGLPLGLQVIGRIGEDEKTLACAGWIEAALRN